MRVTLLGHASVLVELQRRDLSDGTVFADPFEEDMVVSCPQRSIDVDAPTPAERDERVKLDADPEDVLRTLLKAAPEKKGTDDGA